MTEVNDQGISAELIPNLVADLDDEDKEAMVAQTVGSVPLDAKKAAVAEAVESAHDGEMQEVVTQAIKAAPLDARKATVAEAVISASPENKKAVAKEAMESLPSTQRQELAKQLGMSLEMADEVWRKVVTTFQWVLWGSALALVAAIGVALFREVDAAYVQILLTVFTTVAGIFAGFVSGKALGSSSGQ
jgi:hypothetical protein